jgi:hypothetical protein
MTTRRFLLLLLLVAASRVPFIWSGYGSDADAWRVAVTAHHLVDTGEYRVSRFPGFPLYEILVTPFVAAGGFALSNATSIAAMLFILLVWRAILRRTSHHATLLMICLAFTPVLWKNSTVTMDYLWSLLFVLLSLERLITTDRAATSRILVSGIFLGIAVGFRPTNAVMVVPMVTLLLGTGDRGRKTGMYLAATALVAGISFLPPLLTYGPREWYALTRRATTDIVFSFPERMLLFGYRGVYLLGPAAVLTALFILWRSRREVQRACARHDPLLLTAVAGLAAPILLYAVYPLEREYLIPLIPFLYLLLACFASRTPMLIFTLGVASMAFITPDVIRHQGIRGVPELNIHGGALQDLVGKQRLILERRTRLGNLAVAGPAVVMTGDGPEIWVENALFMADTTAFWRGFPEVAVRQRRNPDALFIDALTPGELARVRSAGYRVYCFAPAQEYLEHVLGYRMDEMRVMLVGGTE